MGTQVVIHVSGEAFDRLKETKSMFDFKSGIKTTWSQYLEQQCLYWEATACVHSPVVNADKLNKTWAKAKCPKCAKENGPLLRKRAIIWRIKCDCGQEFIAKA